MMFECSNDLSYSGSKWSLIFVFAQAPWLILSRASKHQWWKCLNRLSHLSQSQGKKFLYYLLIKGLFIVLHPVWKRWVVEYSVCHLLSIWSTNFPMWILLEVSPKTMDQIFYCCCFQGTLGQVPKDSWVGHLSVCDTLSAWVAPLK